MVRTCLYTIPFAERAAYLPAYSRGYTNSRVLPSGVSLTCLSVGHRSFGTRGVYFEFAGILEGELDWGACFVKTGYW